MIDWGLIVADIRLLSIESLGVGLVLVSGHQFGVAADRLALVERGHAALDPLVGDELEEGAGQHARGAAHNRDHEVARLHDRSLEQDTPDERLAGGRLDHDDDQDDEPGEEVALDATASVELIGSDIAAVDQVEDLEEDEGVPDESEVLHLCLGERIVAISDLGGESVVEIEDALAAVHDDHHDGDHVDRHAEDLSVHVGSHDVALAGGEVRQVCLRAGGSERQSTEDIHDQVDVDQLHWVESRLGHRDVTDDDNDKYTEVCSDLELEEALDVHVDVAAPHDGAHARVEVVRLEHHRRVVASVGGAILQRE